jgi:hypothetical protein
VMALRSVMATGELLDEQSASHPVGFLRSQSPLCDDECWRHRCSPAAQEVSSCPKCSVPATTPSGLPCFAPS